jgi:site-specific DNA-methyltransferase (adenine-specific)
MANTILYCGDAAAFKDQLTTKPDALVSDPPYGCSNDCNYTRFSGGLSPSRNFHQGIIGDDQPFDPKPWLSVAPQVVLFGFQYFAQALPVGSVLVWNKRRDNQLGKFLSDAELAWWSKGKGVYIFPHVWNGFDRQSERGEKSKHPSQKPVALFKWIYQKLKLKPGQWVYDPYLGVGASGVAAVEMGLNFIGTEIEQGYFDVALDRIEAAKAQQKTPDDAGA